MLGLQLSIRKAVSSGLRYLKDNLKLYMPFRTASVVKFVGTGSTSFDGSDDYINCGSDSTLDNIFDGGGTISAWIYPNSDGEGNEARIVDKRDDGTGFAFHLITELSGTCMLKFFQNFDSTSGQYISSGDVIISAWNHVAVTYNSGGAGASYVPTFYVNGVASTFSSSTNSVGTAVTDAAENFIIGNTEAGIRTFDGNIKNVGAWERVLSQTEIQNVMYKTYGQLSGTETQGLVSWWALDATGLGTELMQNSNDHAMTTSDGHPAYWKEQYDDTTSSIVTGNGFTGYALRITPESVGSYAGLGQGTEDGTSWYTPIVDTLDYQVSFKYRVKEDGGSILVRNTAGGDFILNFLSDQTGDAVSYTTTFTATSAGRFTFLLDTGCGADAFLELDDISLKEVVIGDLHGSNNGSIYGATIDTDLYGGDTPKIPRAVDNAPTARADTIGNGSALFVVGNEDYISIADDASLDFGTGAFTISGWFKQTAANSAIIAKGTYNGVGDWLIYEALGNFEFRNDNNSGDKRIEFSDATLNGTGWHHFAVTRNGTTVKTYLDGVYKNSGTLEADYDFTNAHNVTIGAREDGTIRWADGNIAQIGIWEAALTQAQIQEVKEKSFAELSASDKTNIVSYWSLDEVNVDSLIFDGTGDTISLGAGEFNFDSDADDFTISIWGRYNGSDQGTLISRAYDSGGSGGWKIASGSSNRIHFYVGGTGRYWTESGAGHQDNEWHLFTLVNYDDGGTQKFVGYVDGVLRTLEGGTVPATSGSTDVPLTHHTRIVGRDHSAGSMVGAFTGQLADVAIWNTALSAADVVSIYNSGRPNDLTEASSYNTDRTSNLQGYWKLDTTSTSANAIVDLSGNSKHGTTAGNPTQGGIVYDKVSTNDGALT